MGKRTPSLGESEPGAHRKRRSALFSRFNETEFSAMDCAPEAMPSSRKSAAHMALANAFAYGPAEDPATLVFRVIDRS